MPKKGGKKAKVIESPEEKALREATEKLKAEEDRRRKEETMRKKLSDDLAEEARFAKLNLAKIQNQWRKLMRLAKVESLRKDLEIMSQNHEREVDMKDAIIQMLDRDCEKSMHASLSHSHHRAENKCNRKAPPTLPQCCTMQMCCRGPCSVNAPYAPVLALVDLPWCSPRCPKLVRFWCVQWMRLRSSTRWRCAATFKMSMLSSTCTTARCGSWRASLRQRSG